MGIATYTARNGKRYAIVGRKNGPKNGGYLWQYLLTDDGTGNVKTTLVRKFGLYSGKKEISLLYILLTQLRRIHVQILSNHIKKYEIMHSILISYVHSSEFKSIKYMNSPNNSPLH